ncbi:MAG TPA: hypothetical protein VG963_00470 [Polyangiaceae bacterium]|jgi:hypothetical protein|nr:hypothetical protein [Polyangiaceae bacterium]
MLGFFARTALRMLALAGVLYVTFFVPLGPRTLYGHMSRIAATSEAHELFAAVGAELSQATQALRAKLDAAHARSE